MSFKNNFDIKIRSKGEKKSIWYWVFFIFLVFVLAIVGTMGKEIANKATQFLFGSEIHSELNITEDDWITYNLSNLIIESPVELLEHNINYPEEFKDLILETKTLGYFDNSFTFSLSTVLYNNIEPNLLGAYQQGMQEMANSKGINNFKSEKQDILLQGRKGYSILATFNIQDRPGNSEGIFLVENSRLWMIQTLYYTQDRNAKIITKKILESIRFTD